MPSKYFLLCIEVLACEKLVNINLNLWIFEEKLSFIQFHWSVFIKWLLVFVYCYDLWKLLVRGLCIVSGGLTASTFFRACLPYGKDSSQSNKVNLHNLYILESHAILKRFELFKFQCRAFLYSNKIYALVVTGCCVYQIVSHV